MVQEVNPSAVLRRWGIIVAIRANGTVDVNVAGQDLPAIRRLASYAPILGERVQIDVVGTDMVVVGATAPRTPVVQIAQITAITDETVTVRTDANQTITGVNRMSGSSHTVNQVVQIQQFGDEWSVVGIEHPPVGYVRQPTGEIEHTLRKTPKPGTLLLDGSSISRTTYKGLFDWAKAQGLFSETAGENLFGPGNTAQEFRIPDLRGRVLSGADATNPLGTKFGATSRSASTTLTPSHLPQVSHTHTIENNPSNPGHAHASGGVGDHQHSWLTAQGGNHGGHSSGSLDWWEPTNAIQRIRRTPTSWTDGSGTHNHSFDSGYAGGHNHSISIEPVAHTLRNQAATTGVAQPTPITVNTDIQQPSFAINYLIWY
jgi:hypothetical protein